MATTWLRLEQSVSPWLCAKTSVVENSHRIDMTQEQLISESCTVYSSPGMRNCYASSSWLGLGGQFLGFLTGFLYCDSSYSTGEEINLRALPLLSRFIPIMQLKTRVMMTEDPRWDRFKPVFCLHMSSICLHSNGAAMLASGPPSHLYQLLSRSLTFFIPPCAGRLINGHRPIWARFGRAFAIYIFNGLQGPFSEGTSQSTINEPQTWELLQSRNWTRNHNFPF